MSIDLSFYVKSGFAFCYALLVRLLDYAGMSKKVFVVITLLMTIDFITGFAKAYVLGEIASKEISRGLLRKTSLLFVVWLIFLAAAISPFMNSFVDLAVGFVVMSELLSIMGNVAVAKKGEAMSENDALEKIIEAANALLNRGLKK